MESKKIFDFLHFNHPTQEQENVLKAMESFIKKENMDDFLILCGAAGTGKTSITSALIGYLNFYKHKYKIAAPTGRAARILGRKSNTSSSTIHSMIYTPHSDSKTGTVSFKLKSGYNSQPAVFIIDEASMIPTKADKKEGLFKVERGLIFDLISFIKGSNTQNKLILLGDHYQLPPIGDSQSYALNKEFLKQTFNMKGNAYLLKEVKRQEDGSYILENATAIRKAIDQRKLKHPIAGKEARSIYAAADRYVAGVRSEGNENAIAIGVSHKANALFNNLVRERVFGRASKILEKGDLLMVTQNWSRNGEVLYNGDQVELLSVDWNLQEVVAKLHFVAVKVKLLFSSEEKIIEDYALLDTIITPGGKIDGKLENDLRRQRYIKNKIFQESNRPGDDRYVGALRLVYGHAITCNKAQGGEWKKVFINTWGIPS
ncbi:MAG: ATP-dependent DNA helicase, partial [Candidatus Cyclobacteriaceae bacterium M3_2C_046]